jgi:hypothetical protein
MDMELHLEIVLTGLVIVYVARKLWNSWTITKEETLEEENRPEEVKGSEIKKDTRIDGPFVGDS